MCVCVYVCVELSTPCNLLRERGGRRQGEGKPSGKGAEAIHFDTNTHLHTLETHTHTHTHTHAYIHGSACRIHIAVSACPVVSERLTEACWKTDRRLREGILCPAVRRRRGREPETTEINRAKERRRERLSLSHSQPHRLHQCVCVCVCVVC